MEISHQKICVIGGGNLGIAIAKGIVSQQLVEKGNLTVTKRRIESISSLQSIGITTSSSNREAVSVASLVILCVQPKQLPQVLAEIRPVMKDQLIISTVAGTTISELIEALGGSASVIRAMPNTASAVGQSMTCLAASADDQSFIPLAEKLFSAIGDTLVIEERLMQAATVLGASGIAFFMRYLRAATQGGIQMGFHPEEAQRIAVQTAKGAATLILEQGSHPEVEIDKVTTPQGCTISGLNEMEHQGFSSALIKGLMTSFDKLNTIK